MAEKLDKFPVVCEGGLDLRQNLVTTFPGAGVEFQNFEPNLHGGYRRIGGLTKFASAVVPGNTAFRPLNAAIFNNYIVSWRVNPDFTNAEADTFYLSYHDGTSWTSININAWVGETVASGFSRVRYDTYNWSGTETMVMVPDCSVENSALVPQTWAGSGEETSLTNGPSNAKYVAEFKRHLFFAGYASNRGAIKFSAPLTANDFTAPSGGGEIVVGDTVTGLKRFRDQLIIFCENSIHRLSGSSLSNFAISPITENIGTIFSDSIQEVNGDIVYLTRDGFRTIAATERNDDFELGTISKPITKFIIEDSVALIQSATENSLCSVVDPSKNQYRLFFPLTSTEEELQPGYVGAIRLTSQNQFQWEWLPLKGIPAIAAASGLINDRFAIVHAALDGYVYKQEVGAAFEYNSGTVAVEAVYTTPEYDFTEPGKRKALHRVISYLEREGVSAIKLNVRHNFNATATPQPAQYTLNGHVSNSIYGVATYGSTYQFIDTDIFQDRLPVSGSNFTCSLKYSSNATTDWPYTIEAFVLEGQIAGNR